MFFIGASLRLADVIVVSETTPYVACNYSGLFLFFFQLRYTDVLFTEQEVC